LAKKNPIKKKADGYQAETLIYRRILALALKRPTKTGMTRAIAALCQYSASSDMTLYQPQNQYLPGKDLR
jgi:hypothetical protein